MRIWTFSDLHLEQSIWDVPNPTPEFDVLVAAGDIHFATDAVAWLAERAEGRPVIYVPGNHEWYASSRPFTMVEELRTARRTAERLGVHLLQDEAVVIGGVRFLGATLWTDYELYGDPDGSMEFARQCMNDHRIIYPTVYARPLDPAEARQWHFASRKWLDDRLAEPSAEPTVVVTHHLPHRRSIHPQFVGDALTAAFCSDLAATVEGGGAALWVHGHTHHSCDYHAGSTRVLCNPKGYGPREVGGPFGNTEFNPHLVVEVVGRSGAPEPGA